MLGILDRFSGAKIETTQDLVFEKTTDLLCDTISGVRKKVGCQLLASELVNVSALFTKGFNNELHLGKALQSLVDEYEFLVLQNVKLSRSIIKRWTMGFITEENEDISTHTGALNFHQDASDYTMLYNDGREGRIDGTLFSYSWGGESAKLITTPDAVRASMADIKYYEKMWEKDVSQLVIWSNKGALLHASKSPTRSPLKTFFIDEKSLH